MLEEFFNYQWAAEAFYLYGLADHVERSPLPDRLTKKVAVVPGRCTRLRPGEGPTLMHGKDPAQATSEGCDLCPRIASFHADRT